MVTQAELINLNALIASLLVRHAMVILTSASLVDLGIISAIMIVYLAILIAKNVLESQIVPNV